MNTTSILIKTDPLIKEKAHETARELGFNLSSVLNAFLIQFVKTKTITFSTPDEEPSDYLLKEMKQAKEDRKAGKASPIFHSADEMITWLKKQGV